MDWPWAALPSTTRSKLCSVGSASGPQSAGTTQFTPLHEIEHKIDNVIKVLDWESQNVTVVHTLAPIAPPRIYPWWAGYLSCS